MSTTDRFTIVASPIGPLLLTAGPGGLTGLYVAGERLAPEPDASWREDRASCAEVIEQLEAYFAGEQAAFDLTVDPKGTPFQLEVWAGLRAIPYGETISYAELARRVGRPAASRAVGAANGRNPISIVLPCHRVIGANGSLTGYGWGLDRKRYLLDLESRGNRPLSET
ncbi:MAG: methylated-DNA--[protein]-cysteine S-methyltransferase [Acidimicrobiia bacterium]|nr:methylated-DNA--[protein]-cysteine S-methyltransferase [Acidimicrobiia bacterium]